MTFLSGTSYLLYGGDDGSKLLIVGQPTPCCSGDIESLVRGVNNINVDRVLRIGLVCQMPARPARRCVILRDEGGTAKEWIIWVWQRFESRVTCGLELTCARQGARGRRCNFIPILRGMCDSRRRLSHNGVYVENDRECKETHVRRASPPCRYVVSDERPYEGTVDHLKPPMLASQMSTILL